MPNLIGIMQTDTQFTKLERKCIGGLKYMEWLALLVPFLISSIGGLITQGVQDQRISEQNKKIDEQNQLMMEREDTAVQRRKEDVVNAGFSPNAVFGSPSAAETGQLTPPNVSDVQPLQQMFTNTANMFQTSVQGHLSRKQQQKQFDDALALQRELQGYQIEGIELDNKRKEIELSDLKTQQMKRIMDMDVDRYTKVALLLANGVITEAQAKELFDFQGNANKNVERELKIKETANANAAKANELAATREANRKAEADREFNASNVDKSTSITISKGPISFTTSRSETGSVLTNADVGGKATGDSYSVSSPNVDGSKWVVSKLFGQKEFKFIGRTDQGLPIYESPFLKKNFVMVPTANGAQLIELENQHDIVGMNYSKYLKDYGSSYESIVNEVKDKGVQYQPPKKSK